MNLDELLKEELKMSAGCTEPAAIAYAAAYAKQRFCGGQIKSVTLSFSSNVLKNALCVNIPSTSQSGVKLIAMLGLISGKADSKLTILRDIDLQQIQKACELAEQIDVQIKVKRDVPTLYIEVEIQGEHDFATVIISDVHDKIQSFESKEGKEVFFEQQNVQKYQQNIDFDDIYDFVINRKYDNSLIKMVKETNSEIGSFGLFNECGLNIGRAGKSIEFIEQKYRDVVCKTVSGIDARMSGANKNVIINSGSGNQGITATVPIIEMAKILDADEQTELDAIALSHLVAIYIRSKQGRLSSSCGAVCACVGAAAGIAYLLGGTKQQIEGAIKSLLCSCFGLFCDGAKHSCALKVNACLIAAVHTAMMSVADVYLKGNSGVISSSLEKTLQHLAQIESAFTQNIDETIMNIAIKNLESE